MQPPHLPHINWQPLIDAAAFALKAGTFVLVVAMLTADDPNWSEVRTAGVAALLGGVIKGGTSQLPEALKKFGV